MSAVCQVMKREAPPEDLGSLGLRFDGIPNHGNRQLYAFQKIREVLLKLGDAPPPTQKKTKSPREKAEDNFRIGS